MRTIVIRKVTNAVITILIILVVNFVLFRMLPGDPAITFIRTGAGHSASPELVLRQREIFGLNDPLIVQIGKYIVNTLTGNWGYSFFEGGLPVTSIIAQKAVWTLLLVGTSTFITIWVGIIIGAKSAWQRGKFFDVFSLAWGFFFYAMPTFWLGYMLIILFQSPGGAIPLFPASHELDYPYPTELWTRIGSALYHLILPALALTLVQIAGISLIMRNSLIDTLTEDYITTAHAKGLSDRAVLKAHAMPNARLPMVTVIALDAGFILGGAIQTEEVFSYQGLGWLTVEAVLKGDYPLLQGLFLLITFSVVIANLVADFVYAWMDPRVRLE
jgi:peptide/nickel transport system permease protein